MKKLYNKFLIISTLFLVIGGMYLYSSNQLDSKGVVPVAFGSSLASSNGGDPSVLGNSSSDKISADIAFLATLVELKKIEIDTSIFTNESFNKLQNNIVIIEPVIAGRLNPFAPISATSNNSASSKVVTNQPTKITSLSAVFNGTLNTTAGVTDTYFEYGISSQGMGNITTITKQSLVGTFLKNVTGLTPKTSYSFRACAKINNIAICGETVSFTTQ